MGDNDDLKQRRQCRCCQRMYDYAVPGSHSTRFLCPDCAALPEPIRKVFISMNKRIIELETQLKAQAKMNISNKW